MQPQSELQPLRVGVVGIGWAGETHIKAYQQIPGVEVVAIADQREDRLRQVCATYNIPGFYTSFQELIDRTDIDIVSVATPNALHMPVAVAALESGKHVLSEKPLARTAGEAEQMVKAAISSGRVLKTAFNHRERGDVQVLKAAIDSGMLGRIYHAKAFWMRRAGIPGMGGWFTSKELAGGGPLIDLGVHVLDMAMYLLGEPTIVAVSAQTYAELGPRGRGSRGDKVATGVYEVEDYALALIRLENGITLNLDASWAVYGKQGDDFGVTLFGTDGGADIDIRNYATQDTLRIFTDTAGTPSEVRVQNPRGEGHLGVVRQFIEIIRSGNWVDHKGREGLRRAQIIDACYRSAVEGREIQLVDVAAKL